VLGDELADRIGRDLLALQDRGLDGLDADRRASLRELYAAFGHPAAREILAWLDGEWEVSDEEVRTL
jgi:hypothetical protein